MICEFPHFMQSPVEKIESSNLFCIEMLYEISSKLSAPVKSQHLIDIVFFYHTDARFPEFTKVELIFSNTPDALHGSDYVSGASFPSEHIDDPLIRWDSYEHFNDIIEGPEGISHTPFIWSGRLFCTVVVQYASVFRIQY